MTQSDPTPTVRDALLSQGRTGNEPIDAEIGRLQQLVEADRSRARRLTRWTIAVWSLAALAILSIAVVPLVMYFLAQARPSGAPADSGRIIAPIVLTMFFLAIPVLIVCFIAGIVLSVMTILARRTASMHEIQSSLASIDAQLRVLSVTGAGKVENP